MIDVPGSLEEAIERVFCLPTAFHLRGPASLMLLVQETGYVRHREALTVERLQAGIRGRQGLVDSWLRYSAEKEADWGWFFQGPDRGVYRVGKCNHFLAGPRQFTDAGEACAFFIRSEFEALAGNK
jgi:hypothetical protein